MKQIVVAVDGSECSLQALAWARELARSAPEATFHLVHAFQPIIPVTASVHAVGPALDSARLAGESLLAPIAREMRGLPTEIHVRQGAPARAVLDIAKEFQADLLAVGRRGLAPAAAHCWAASAARSFITGSGPFWWSTMRPPGPCSPCW